MLEAVATILLLGMTAAFAVCAVLLNERGRTRGHRIPAHEAARPAGDGALSSHESAAVSAVPTGERRLPVGDFLFGALFLRGPEPVTFSELADAADGSGMSVAQVLAWIERTEAGGLIERVSDDEAGEPALRLTEAGIYVACNDRRRGRRARKLDESRATRALHR